jgi:nucleotide-binding universal stress UspA family protein
MVVSILVPLDGSELARRALDLASSLAKATGARIVLVRARPDITSAHFGRLETVRLARARNRLATRKVQNEMNDLAMQLEAKGIAATISLDVGEPDKVILRLAGAHEVDLIVMSTQGRGGLQGHWLFGSVADAVLRQSPIPVLLVTPAAETAWPRDRAPRLLVPLDGSAFAEEALGPALALAKNLAASLLLLRIVEPDPPGSPLKSYGEEEKPLPIAEAERYLDGVARYLDSEGVAVRQRIVTGSPASAIASVARDEKSDLVTMSTHGRGGVARVLMGSTAIATLQQIATPLLLVRPLTIRGIPHRPSEE